MQSVMIFFPMILNFCKPLISKTFHDEAFYNQQHAKWYIFLCVCWIFHILVSTHSSCTFWEQLSNCSYLPSDHTGLTDLHHVSHCLSPKLKTSSLTTEISLHISDHLDLYCSSKLLLVKGKEYPRWKHYLRCK